MTGQSTENWPTGAGLRGRGSLTRARLLLATLSSGDLFVRRQETKAPRFSLAASGKSSGVASRDTRREQNQKLFRMGNERLSAAVNEQAVPETASVPFLCECADEFCDGKVELDRRQWESIASNPNEYVMVPGHPRSEGEVVVGALDGYDVVRKPE